MRIGKARVTGELTMPRSGVHSFCELLGSHPTPCGQHKEQGSTADCPLGVLQQKQPPSLLLWDLWVPVGRLSQAFEQVLEESWVALWAVIVFTALLAEALIHKEGRPLLSKSKMATVSGLQHSQRWDWSHPFIEASLAD